MHASSLDTKVVESNKLVNTKVGESNKLGTLDDDDDFFNDKHLAIIDDVVASVLKSKSGSAENLNKQGILEIFIC